MQVKKTSSLLLSVLVGAGVSFGAWQEDFRDDFNGTALDGSKWYKNVENHVNNEKQCYVTDEGTGENIEVANGILRMRVKQETRNCSGSGYNHGTMYYTSARLITKNKFEAKRGAWETKFKLWDSGNIHGKWPSFWFLTNRISEPPTVHGNETAQWPVDGAQELDVWEWVDDLGGTFNTNFIKSCCPNVYAGSDKPKAIYQKPGNPYSWHVIRAEWCIDGAAQNDKLIRIYDNGVLVRTGPDNSAETHGDTMFCLLQYAFGGDMPGNVIWPAGANCGVDWDYVKHEKWVTDANPPTPPSGNNLLANGDFSGGLTSWDNNFLSPAAGTHSVTGGVLQTAITTTSTDNYRQQIFQTGNLNSGTFYSYSFDAKCNSGTRDIKFVIERNGGDYYKMVERTINLTTTMTTFTGTFTANQTGTFRYEFQGANNATGYQIDNCKLNTGSGSSYNVYTSGDATVRSGTYAGANQAGTSATSNDVKTDQTADYTRELYMFFDFTGQNAVAVTSAKLKYYVNSLCTSGGITGNPDIAINKIWNNTWTEGGITWNNRSLAGDPDAATSNITNIGWVTVDITDMYNFELTNGDKKMTLRLRATNEENAAKCIKVDSEEGTNKPYILVMP
jgi:hypothetical protein